MEQNSKQFSRFKWWAKHWVVYNVATFGAVVSAYLFYIYAIHVFLSFINEPFEIDGPTPPFIALFLGLLFLPIGNSVYILLGLSEWIKKPSNIKIFRRLTYYRLIRYSIILPFVSPPLALFLAGLAISFYQ